jgi:hypothetical protein
LGAGRERSSLRGLAVAIASLTGSRVATMTASSRGSSCSARSCSTRPTRVRAPRPGRRRAAGLPALRRQGRHGLQRRRPRRASRPPGAPCARRLAVHRPRARRQRDLRRAGPGRRDRVRRLAASGMLRHPSYKGVRLTNLRKVRWSASAEPRSSSAPSGERTPRERIKALAIGLRPATRVQDLGRRIVREGAHLSRPYKVGRFRTNVHLRDHESSVGRNRPVPFETRWSTRAISRGRVHQGQLRTAYRAC